MSQVKGQGKSELFDGSPFRIAIVHSRWNTKIISALVDGARRALLSAGVREGNIVVQSVPGSFELPFGVHQVYAASKLSDSPQSGIQSSRMPFDAIIAIGVLIKGETMHFEYIADATSHCLMKAQIDLGVPVIFGLLTVLNEEQGMARAGLVEGSHCHGEDWGQAALEMAAKGAFWRNGQFHGYDFESK